MRKRKLPAVISFFAVIILLVCIVGISISHVRNKGNDFGDSVGDEIVMSEKDFRSWSELSEYMDGEQYESMSMENREEIVMDAVENLKGVYGFDSYDINFEHKPLVVSLFFADGHVEAIELGERNPKENFP